MMTELNENMVSENNETVEYEYVELEEGQELPEGYEYEYEYVEVSDDSVSELDVIGNSDAEVAVADETELASAEEIEAAMKPLDLDEEITNTSTVPEKENISDPNGSGASNDDNSLRKSIFEGLFDEPDDDENVADEGGLDISISDKNDENTFVEPDDLKFQNDTSEDEKAMENWFNPSDESVLSEESVVETEQVVSNDEDKNISVENNLSMETDVFSEDVAQDNIISSQKDVLLNDNMPQAKEDVTGALLKNVEEVVEKAEIIPVEEVNNLDLDISEDISLDDLLDGDDKIPFQENEEITLFEKDDDEIKENVVEEIKIEEEQEAVEQGIPAISGLSFSDVETEDSDEVLNVEPEIVEVSAVAEEDNIADMVDEEVSLQPDYETKNNQDISLADEEKTDIADVVSDAYGAIVGNSNDIVTIIDTANENETVINPKIKELQIKDCSAELFVQRAAVTRLVSKNDGIQFFKATADLKYLALNEIDFEQNELRSWNLIIFNRNVIPLSAKVSELNMPIQPNVCRLASLVKDGVKKVDFFNEDKLKIINATGACIAVDGRFICGDLQNHSGLIVEDMQAISLIDFAGKEFVFDSPMTGILSGPNGALLFFDGVCGILVPGSDIAKADAEKLQYKISKWYSGTLNDKYFEFDAQSPSAEFEGNDEINAIHVNVNNSSYGWNVTFDNGLSMNLRDLREYQTRLGKMPSPNGVISYGQNKLTFSKVERIVVYESAQYYFYA